MSYPQQPASAEVLKSQEFYRLKTEVQSSGDVYEIDVSAKAFVIGPESTVSGVKISYYDPTKKTPVREFVVQPGVPFLGRVDALDTETYDVVNSKARILVSPIDVIDNTFEPDELDPNEQLARIKPVIDLQAFLNDPDSVAQKRADFCRKGRAGITSGNPGEDDTFILIPHYGRRFVSVTAVTQTLNVQMALYGYRFLADEIGVGIRITESILVGLTNVVSGTGTRIFARASQFGLFDYIGVRFKGGGPVDPTGSGAIAYTIISTDEEV